MMNRPATSYDLNRVCQFGKLCWEHLHPDERESWYCTLGTYEFVEQIICMLRLFDVDFTDEQFTEMHEYICKEEQ